MAAFNSHLSKFKKKIKHTICEDKERHLSCYQGSLYQYTTVSKIAPHYKTILKTKEKKRKILIKKLLQTLRYQVYQNFESNADSPGKLRHEAKLSICLILHGTNLCLQPCYIFSKVLLVCITLCPLFANPFHHFLTCLWVVISLSLIFLHLKLSSPSWPACWQSCFYLIWSIQVESISSEQSLTLRKGLHGCKSQMPVVNISCTTSC